MVHFYSLRYLIATNEAQTKKRTCVRFLFFSYAKYLLRSPSNALPCLAFSVITRSETVPRTVSPKFILNLEPRGKGRSQTKKRTCVRFLFFSYAKYLLRSPSNALPCLAFSVITRSETVPRTVSPKFILNLEPRGKGRSQTKKRTCVRFLFFSYAKYLLRSPSNALPCLASSLAISCTAS